MSHARGGPFRPQNPQKIIDRYLAGEFAKDIAVDFGYLNGTSINKFLREAGVELRDGKAERRWREKFRPGRSR